MDILTHLALGACIGEAVAGKMGKKAMLFGALANSLPDIDFAASLWLKPDENLLAHRGITHSFMFAIIGSFFFGFICFKLFRKINLSLRKWILFFVIQILAHLFIDAFNSYGIGWLEPFWHNRISFNVIFVADPFYSIWPGIAVAALIFLKKNSVHRKFWYVFGLGMSSFYFCYCVTNKIKINAQIKNILAKQHIVYSDYFTTPTPLNNWLWYIVTKNDSGYNTGYYSVFDNKKKIDLQFFPKNDLLLDTIRQRADVQHLISFSKGFYCVEKNNTSLVFNVLRFGQINGWENPHAKFVFHYYLGTSANNVFVMQRGRFAGWNWETAKSLLKRIRGQ